MKQKSCIADNQIVALVMIIFITLFTHLFSQMRMFSYCTPSDQSELFLFKLLNQLKNTIQYVIDDNILPKNVGRMELAIFLLRSHAIK